MENLFRMPYFCTGRYSHSSPTVTSTDMPLPNSANTPISREGILVREYLVHANLCPSGCRGVRQRDSLTEDALNALLALTDEYERHYGAQLDELATNWSIGAQNPHVSFVEVLDTIFMDGCNWGRVVTVFIFIGMFLRKCQTEAAGLVSVDDVTDWSVAYLRDQLGPWIGEHGGWLGLVQFHRDGDAENRLDMGGRMFKRLITLAGASIVLLSLGSLLTNRA